MNNLIEKIILIICFGFKFKKKIFKIYIQSKKQNNDIILYKIKNQLLQFDEKYKKILHVSKILKLNFSLHQYIYGKIINTRIFNILILRNLIFKNKVIFPLPINYLLKIDKEIQVNFFLSYLMWIFLTFFLFFINFFKILFSFTLFFKFKTNKDKYKIYFNMVTNSVFESGKKNSNFEFFFLDNYKLKKKETTVYFSSPKFPQKKKLIYCKNILNADSHISDLKAFFIASLYSFKFFVKVLINIKIDYLILFNEIFLFYFMLKKKKIFNFVFFNNTAFSFRPLWTFAQEFRKKKTCIFYFYSTNNSPLGNYLTKNNFYDTCSTNLLNWPNYLVWSKEQLVWLRAKDKNFFNYRIINFIPFEGKKIYVSTNLKKKIVLFDTPPQNQFYYSFMINHYNIYTVDYVIKFLDHLIKNLVNKDFQILIKLKRNLNKNYYHNKYINYIKQIENFDNLKLLNENYTAESVIKCSDASISIPFTTTALISKFYKKKTVYYDPSGKLDNNFIMNQKIKLLKGEEDLQSWIQEI